MKTSFASVLLVFVISACSSKQAETSATQEVEVTYTKDDQQITETLEIDTATFNLMKALVEGRKPEDLIKGENDSIFSKEGRLDYVVLGSDVYGAAIKQFYYNEKGQLVRLVGFSEEGSIAPFFEYVAIHEQDYDSEGRLIEERFLDANGAFVGPGLPRRALLSSVRLRTAGKVPQCAAARATPRACRSASRGFGLPAREPVRPRGQKSLT